MQTRNMGESLLIFQANKFSTIKFKSEQKILESYCIPVFCGVLVPHDINFLLAKSIFWITLINIGISEKKNSARLLKYLFILNYIYILFYILNK